MKKFKNITKNIFNKNIESLLFKNNLISKKFSYIYNNYPCAVKYKINNKIEKLDLTQDLYNSIIEEFLNKKWTEKSEIIKIMNDKYNIPHSPNKINFPKYENNLNNIENKFVYKDIPETDLTNEHNQNLNTNYIANILIGNEDYQILDNIVNNIILNGYYINKDNIEDYKNHKKELDDLVQIFYNGDILTENEKIIHLIYLTQKYKKFKYFKANNNKDYYCKFTEKDYINFLPICFSQELYINKSIFLSEDIFYNKYNPNLKSIDIDLLFDMSDKMKRLGNNFFMKIFYVLFKNNHLLNNVIKSEMIAYCILAKVNFFLQTEEFCKEFDYGFDFFISNAILSLHIWLIIQRLNNFKRSKASYELINNIIKLNKKICNSLFQNVDTLRKMSKFAKIEENAEEQKNKFHWHFNIYNPTVENNFLKIDSLVWSYIFREKIDRYDDKIYKMSHYIVYHFNKFKELDFYDFKNLNFDFNLNCIPQNYKANIIKFNPPLSKNDQFLENYNNFIYRSYVYSYKTEIERSFNNLYKTFIRYTHDQTFDKKNYLMMSRRKEDDLYDILKDKERSDELNNNLNIDDNSSSINVFKNLFNLWNAKYFTKIIEVCEKEDRQREMNNYNDLREITPGVKRFSEKLNFDIKKKLYVYRYNLLNNPNSQKDIFILHESKLLYPDSNVINKKRRNKNLVEKLFKL